MTEKTSLIWAFSNSSLLMEALNHGKLAKHLHCPSSGHLSEVGPHFQTSSLDGIPSKDGDCKIRSRIRGEEESVKNTCSVERQVKAILVLNLPVNLPVLDLAVHWPVGRFRPSQTSLEREHHESHRVCLSWDWVSCTESTQRSTQHTSGAHVMACVLLVNFREITVYQRIEKELIFLETLWQTHPYLGVSSECEREFQGLGCDKMCFPAHT